MLTRVTAGEFGASQPPLFNRAMKSFNPALVIVAGNDNGIVKTESMIWMIPPRKIMSCLGQDKSAE